MTRSCAKPAPAAAWRARRTGRCGGSPRATRDVLANAPAAVEAIDRYVLDSTRLNPEASRLRDFIRGDPGAILLVEFYADRPEDLPPRLDALEADLRRRGHGYHAHRAGDA